MKALVRIFIIWAIPLTSPAQMKQPSFAAALHDSLRVADNDTLRMLIYGSIQGYYSGRNIDSTLFYLDQGILTARKIKQPLWAGRYAVIKAYHLQSIYNFSQSFRLCNEAMAIAQDRRNEKNLYIPPWDRSGIGNDPARFRMGLTIAANHQLGSTYSAAGNKEKAIEYYRKAILLANEIRDTLFLVNTHRYIGEIYGEMGRLDSSLLYSEKALEYAKLKRKASIPPILINIGYAFMKRGSLDSAERYFRQSITTVGVGNNMAGMTPGFISLAELFEKLEKPDSVLHYATAAYTIGKEMNNANVLRSSSEKIAWAWKRLGNPDSALNYIYLSKNIGDSLDKEKTDNLILFQNTAFEEQLKLEKQAQESIRYKNKIRTIGLSSGLAILSLLAFIFYRNNRQKHKANTVLQKAFSDLKATQAQLIQSEKMASLGELTAGIAHEIQNPLNFVNNFSEVNKELLTELKDEMRKGNLDEANAIANDVISNEEKINCHGKRADAIVKGMLQHSRNSTGQKERTDINALCDEYLRLAYHGLRAKEKSFNASFESHLDDKIGLVNVVPQDIGRVVLNLLNNAFYAVNERQKHEGAGYVPLVKVASSKQDDRVVISVADNGTGIPDKVKEKIFQPFFTTKPTGQGTGLGLSMSYDIITKGHGGELLVQSREGEGTEFIIKLPIDRANP